MNPAQGLARTWTAAWSEALANRQGFAAQMAVMATNDLAWVVFWVLFFNRVGSLRGWDGPRVLVLFSVVATTAGIVLGALANARQISELAATGGLDPMLALPLPTLPYLLCRRVSPISLGDVAFGLALFLAVGHPTPARLALFSFGVVCGSLALLGFLVLVGSLVFWIGPTQASELGLTGATIFAMYPIDVFGGPLRLILYGVVPAALVGSLPARLIDHPGPGPATGLALGAVAFALAGTVTFNRGLRRYTSGASWTDA